MFAVVQLVRLAASPGVHLHTPKPIFGCNIAVTQVQGKLFVTCPLHVPVTTVVLFVAQAKFVYCIMWLLCSSI